MSDDQDHQQDEEAFDIEALLDSVQESDGYHPTSKTPSFFYNSSQVINDLKHVASFSLVGEPKLDLRARWGLQMNLENHVRVSSPLFSSLRPHLPQQTSDHSPKSPFTNKLVPMNGGLQ